MNIAIVILNWNGKQLLEQFLPSVIQHSEGTEVYVADNASTDESVAFVSEHYPQVKIVQNTMNGGYAKGYNDALQHICADVYCLLNSDVEVTQNWLTPIVAHFKDHPNTAAVQPKILDHKDKTKFEYAGAGGGLIDKYGYPYCRGRRFTSIETDTGQYNDTTEIFWASGACCFIRAEVFHKLNGFDEDYFAHQEEIDLCWRIHNQGLNIMYIGQSTVYHVGGATLDYQSTKKSFLNFRNSLYSIVKNAPKGKVFSTVFMRLVLDGIAAMKFVLDGKPKYILAVLKAHFSFYGNLAKMLGKRSSTQKKDYYQTKSIVWDYFVKKKQF